MRTRPPSVGPHILPKSLRGFRNPPSGVLHDAGTQNLCPRPEVVCGPEGPIYKNVKMDQNQSKMEIPCCLTFFFKKCGPPRFRREHGNRVFRGGGYNPLYRTLTGLFCLHVSISSLHRQNPLSPPNGKSGKIGGNRGKSGKIGANRRKSGEIGGKSVENRGNSGEIRLEMGGKSEQELSFTLYVGPNGSK